MLVWKPPVYDTIHHLLTNPIYAGAYAFGRTGSRTTIENGRKRIVRGLRKERADWDVLILDHHAGYLSWAEFERNLRLIADNATGMGMKARGALRKGELILAGLASAAATAGESFMSPTADATATRGATIATAP